ncbi:MAG TPA: hypothetical protein VF898_12915 [Chloroflexota bacterium]
MSVVTLINADASKVRETSWKEYAIRFAFGGVIAAVVGVLGKLFGPVVAGLFLAFPAILLASLTLLSRHDGEMFAGVDALGAGLGSMGLVAFGAVVWFGADRYAAWIVLLAASVAWFVVSIGLWMAYWTIRNRGRQEHLAVHHS